MSHHDPCDFTMVIPAYNAGAALAGHLEKLERILEQFVGPHFEILVVDDGSADDTAAIAEAHSENVRCLVHETNRGKGAAVCTGMRAARGARRFFTDADLPYELDVLPRMYRALSEGVDFVVGSRALAESNYVVEPAMNRRLASHLFTFLVSETLGLGAIDTQCGLKGFTADAAEFLFARVHATGFAFDVELFALALQHGMAMKTFPVSLVQNGASTVRFRRHGVETLRELWRIRRLRQAMLPQGSSWRKQS